MTRHLYSEEISQWIAGERPEATQLHLRGCAQCRAEVERMDAAFALFRDSAERWSGHWQAKPTRPPARLWSWQRLAVAGSLTAALLVGAVWIRRPVPVVSEVLFVEIPYVAPLAPYERTNVMRMEVPVEALIAAGFEVQGQEPGAAVTADVLVGQDGRAHAIRLLSNSNGRVRQ